MQSDLVLIEIPDDVESERDELGSRERPLPIPRSPNLASAFDPRMLPKTFVHVYPYGVGGFEDERWRVCHKLGMPLREHIISLLLCSDQRFSRDEFWLPFAFDLHQRMLVNRLTKVRVLRSSFQRMAGTVAAIQAEEIRGLLDKMQDDTLAHLQRCSPAIDRLLQSTRFVMGGLVGSEQARMDSRNHLKATVTAFGEFGDRGDSPY